MKYLIETALLTHGLRSLTNNYLLENWTLPEALIAWIYKGEILGKRRAPQQQPAGRAQEGGRK